MAVAAKESGISIVNVSSPAALPVFIVASVYSVVSASSV